MLSESSIQSVFHPIMEEIQEHRDRILADSITIRLGTKEHYRCNLYFRREVENQVLDNELDNSVINFFIDGQNLKEVKESSQDSICWNIKRQGLTPATSI